jgi:hypothetical protein
MMIRIKKTVLISFLIVALILTGVAIAQDNNVLLRENFRNLDNWKPVAFPKIKKHSIYSIEHDADRHYLRAESNESASAIAYKESFDVSKYPHARWRWKISNVYVNGNAMTKEGDDYPIRVYIMFEYDPDKAGIFERMQYGLAKQIYGEYPPHSSLSYVWANKDEPGTIVSSPFTDRAKMIFLRKGPEKVGTWQIEAVNILEDYQKAFGTTPPGRARIAIMNDSDNTGDRSVSYVEYIEVCH